MGTDTEFAECHTLNEHNGDHVEWIVKNEDKKEKEGSLAYYQVQAMSALYAFRIYDIREKQKKKTSSKDSHQKLLASTPVEPHKSESNQLVGQNFSDSGRREITPDVEIHA